MTQGFDLVEGLAAGLEDRAAAWWFVQDFALHWVAPIEDGDGWDEAELAAAEERLGLRLPAALREAYALFGRRPDLTSNHDALHGPADLHLDDRGEVLVFRHENQGACAWGIPLAELHRPDPAVLVRADLADKQAEAWEPWLDRLSIALLELVLSESLHAPEGRCDYLDALDEEGRDALERHYDGLPFPDYPDGAGPGDASRWYAGEDVLLRVDGGDLVYARARAPKALDELRERIPGDWLDSGAPWE
ncbi:SMI1/KNR4 family protein [Kitasatospora sp. NPDC059571]|uniref:SMI1/KNR4 family protein n=1 Tax=Kitasatospora sp. NPDC059571 TaxID=3346871 RepID=UPI0036BA8C54